LPQQITAAWMNKIEVGERKLYVAVEGSTVAPIESAVHVISD
jgi:hypothetical protein